MSYTGWIWTHLQTALLILAVVLRIKYLQNWLTIATMSALSLSMLPIAIVDLNGYMLPITGILSLTSILLLLEYLGKLTNCVPDLPDRERYLLLNIIVIIGFILYPTALGLSAYDVYGLGFSAVAVPLWLGSVAIFTWWVGMWALPWILLAVLWAWLLDLSESQNIWDYMLDPWLFLYAIYKSLPLLQWHKWKEKMCILIIKFDKNA